RFDEDLTDDAAAARAEREPGSELGLTRDRASVDENRDVRARRHQEQSDEKQYSGRLARRNVRECARIGHDSSAKRLLTLFGRGAGQQPFRGKLRVCAFEREACLEPTEDEDLRLLAPRLSR